MYHIVGGRMFTSKIIVAFFNEEFHLCREWWH